MKPTNFIRIQVVAKDTHLMLVALAAKCLAGLAHGLRTNFNPYAVCKYHFKIKNIAYLYYLAKCLGNISGVAYNCDLVCISLYTVI